MELEQRLRADIDELADGIGPRHPGVPEGLRRAEDFVERRLREAGLVPRREAFTVRDQAWCNLVADLPGSGGAAEPLVLCAHYDSVPDVAGAPGADDNASGVAVLLELARRAAAAPLPRPLRILACANEEGMRWDRDGGGSWRHLLGCQERGERPVAAVVLDALGWYDPRAGTQAWPAWWMGLVHGTRGDFLCVQAHWRDRGLARACVRAARAAGGLPVRGCWWPGQRWQLMGDQDSFVRAGIPVVALTDTDRFRNPRFHRPSDRPEAIDLPGLAAASEAAWAVAVALAQPA